jgi:uncharacterized protein YutE (UPF0331/DUF86 family)
MIKRNKIRIDEIEKKLSDVIDNLSVIEENLPEKFNDFLSMGLAKDGLYKKLEYTLESVIDICNIINSDSRFGVPDDEENLLNNLEENKVFDKKTVSMIREMKRFRNVLVHKYGDIDDKLAFEDIKEGLPDFEKVIKEIEKFLKKERKK